jgi:hypothetical protein
MSTTYVNLLTKEGGDSYSSKAYYNYEIFKMLFGGSPSDWASKLPASAKQGLNWNRILNISKKFGLTEDYVAGINLSDECINYQSGANLRQHLQNWGCTSIAVEHVIGQTLDLFTVELCVVRDGEATYVTMPPYLCLLGMGKHLAMCTNHLFDSVSFDGVPISHIRRTLLDLASLDEALAYLRSVKPTTSVNFILSDGKEAIDVEVSQKGITITHPYTNGKNRLLAHTNHVLPIPFYKDTQCNRLQTVSRSLLDGNGVEHSLGKPGVVQPIDTTAQFGTIITVWLDPKERILAYKDPGQTTFTQLKV